MNSSVKFVIRPSKILSNGKHILFLRVTINRKVKFYSLGTQYACTEKEWDAKNEQFRKGYNDASNANLHLKSTKGKANKVLIELEMLDKEYSIHDFDTLYKVKPNSLMILSYFDKTVKTLAPTNYGNSKVFRDTKNSIESFIRHKKGVKSDYPMTSINVDFLKKYEDYLREINPETGKPKNFDTSISIRMRTLRRLFNLAIEETKLANYPFENYSLKHLNKKTKKRALKAEDIKRIFDVNLSSDCRKYKSLRYFKFMFYSRGMNFTDIALLRKTDILNGEIIYKRAKTKKQFTFPIAPQAKEIIESFKEETGYSNYVFPILLPQHIAPSQKHHRIKSILRDMNSDLKEISTDAGVNVPLTSYYTRHSFATILKYNGVPIPKISELLGHENIQTTEIYLDSFDYEELNQVAEDMFTSIDKIEIKKTVDDKVREITLALTNKIPWLKGSKNPILEAIQFAINPENLIISIDGDYLEDSIYKWTSELSDKPIEYFIDLIESSGENSIENIIDEINKKTSEEDVLNYLVVDFLSELIVANS
jgi:integrase/recombinase XerD